MGNAGKGKRLPVAEIGLPSLNSAWESGQHSYTVTHRSDGSDWLGSSQNPGAEEVRIPDGMTVTGLSGWYTRKLSAWAKRNEWRFGSVGSGGSSFFDDDDDDTTKATTKATKATTKATKATKTTKITKTTKNAQDDDSDAFADDDN